MLTFLLWSVFGTLLPTLSAQPAFPAGVAEILNNMRKQQAHASASVNNNEERLQQMMKLTEEKLTSGLAADLATASLDEVLCCCNMSVGRQALKHVSCYGT